MAEPAAARGFDIDQFFDALDGQRRRSGLSWPGVARAMWQLSADFNAQHEKYHPIAASTITGMPRRGDTTCQHAMVMLRWLDRAPEEFIAQPRAGTAQIPLPEADPAHTLRWDLRALYTALNDARLAREASWQQSARRLHCTPSQLTGLRTAKYATGMRLAMRICQGLGQPAADFVHAADW